MPKTLEVTTHINAPVDQVWQLVSDLRRMSEFSPQCRKVIARGPIRQGTRMLNINRNGWMWWPTSSAVVEFVPNERIAFQILENKMVWSYTIRPDADGTTVVHRREAPYGTTKLSKALIQRGFGGEEKFEGILKRGMTQTLYAIKQRVERSV